VAALEMAQARIGAENVRLQLDLSRATVENTMLLGMSAASSPSPVGQPQSGWHG
jgi:hypothetical protein